MRSLALALMYLAATLAHATPGGLDANGCHNSKKKDFHCHAPRDKAKAKDQGSGESRTQREARLLRECQGRPNGGACVGYAKGAADPVR
ncbi:MAG: hypothetical protein ABWY08_04435 [Comamonas sp.]